MYKKYYSRFLESNEGKLHFASHSHHYWPDVTRQATLDYWDDSASWVDHKWEYFFSKKIPRLQKRIAQELNLSAPERIAFAPNTHELFYRLLSCFPTEKKIKILTSDSEFYSFTRQIKRLKEDDLVDVVEVPTLPFSNFQERFIEKSKQDDFDLIYVSHVFFNSGLAIEDLDNFVLALPSPPQIVVDAYHGFMALKTNLEKIEKRIFYLSGSYKYAQGGEGGCFITIPAGHNFRPRYTGWFAELGELAEEKKGQTKYSKDALCFAGSTIDMTPLYRLQSCFDLFDKIGISTNDIHQWVLHLQSHFLSLLDKQEKTMGLKTDQLINIDSQTRGHFLTFELKNSEETLQLVNELKSKNILVDSRANRLRFGFGLYQDISDIDELFKRLEC